MIPQQEDRSALLAKALRYQPVRNPVDGEDLAVIRFALERGVKTHGAGGCVRGIYNDVTLLNAGAVTARYLSRVRELVDVGEASPAVREFFERELIEWWINSGHVPSPGTQRKERSVLRHIRAWVADDPVLVWLEDQCAPFARIVGRPACTPMGPYTADELNRIFSWTSTLPTELRGLRAVAAIGLYFGAGLRRRDVVGVEVADVFERSGGVRVRVGEVELPVRPEVSSALLSVKDRSGALSLNESRLFGLAKNYPAGLSVSPHRLAETWGVVELATGTAFSVVSDRLGRSPAVRAAAFVESFGHPESVAELGIPLKVQAARRVEAYRPSHAAMSAPQAYTSFRVIDGGLE